MASSFCLRCCRVEWRSDHGIEPRIGPRLERRDAMIAVPVK